MSSLIATHFAHQVIVEEVRVGHHSQTCVTNSPHSSQRCLLFPSFDSIHCG